jgi:hypothetical protein
MRKLPTHRHEDHYKNDLAETISTCNKSHNVQWDDFLLSRTVIEGEREKIVSPASIPHTFFSPRVEKEE